MSLFEDEKIYSRDEILESMGRSWDCITDLANVRENQLSNKGAAKIGHALYAMMIDGFHGNMDGWDNLKELKGAAQFLYDLSCHMGD